MSGVAGEMKVLAWVALVVCAAVVCGQEKGLSLVREPSFHCRRAPVWCHDVLVSLLRLAAQLAAVPYVRVVPSS